MRRVKADVARFYPYNSKRMMDAARREAAYAVTKAVADGELKQQPCEECGRRGSEAHHEDYAKPLEVRWLCRFHHRRRDAELLSLRRQQLRTEGFTLTRYSPRRRNKSMTDHPAVAELVRQATNALVEAMRAERMTEADIANYSSSSRQMVNTNFAGGIRTLKALAVYADAIGYDVQVALVKRQEMAVSA